MRVHSVDYREDYPNSPKLVHRGFWVRDVPRVIGLCRLFSHRAVVDGTDAHQDQPPVLWVACDRCGIRPDPQGHLDPEKWTRGQRYDGEFLTRDIPVRVRKQLAARGHMESLRQPGAWPAQPTGTIGGELVIGKGSAMSVSLKVGNAGSEQVLSGGFGITGLFHLYLHAEDHGRRIQRWLNPTGYESKVIEARIHDRRLWTQLWARRNSSSKSDPWWMHGSVRLDPRDILLGEVRNSWEDVGEPATATVRMPEGDEHEVVLKLQKWATGRKHGRKTFTWHADWSSKAGVPFRNHEYKGDCVYGSTVAVTAAGVDTGRWINEAAAAIAVQASQGRARYNYRAPASA